MIDSGAWAFSNLWEVLCIGAVAFTWVFNRELVRAFLMPTFLLMLLPVGVLHALAFGSMKKPYQPDYLGGLIISSSLTALFYIANDRIRRRIVSGRLSSDELYRLSNTSWTEMAIVMFFCGVISVALLVMTIESWLK